jgi:multidrug efflux pump subunit AcrA (membrane-fusion protein)
MSRDHAEGPEADTNDRAPVKAGRAILFLVVAAIAITASISGRRRGDEPLNQWTQEQAIPRVAVVTPQRGGPTRELVLPGNVEAFFTASIHGQTRGYVQEWRKDIGGKVFQGEVLAVLDTPELDERSRGAKRTR